MCNPLLDYMKLKKRPPLETTQKKNKKNILKLNLTPPSPLLKYYSIVFRVTK